MKNKNLHILVFIFYRLSPTRTLLVDLRELHKYPPAQKFLARAVNYHPLPYDAPPRPPPPWLRPFLLTHQRLCAHVPLECIDDLLAALVRLRAPEKALQTTVRVRREPALRIDLRLAARHRPFQLGLW